MILTIKILHHLVSSRDPSHPAFLSMIQLYLPDTWYDLRIMTLSTQNNYLMVGTEEGKIICCSKKAKNPTEVIINKFRGHHGPIRGLQRNPAFSKNFLSIGDWSARVWADDVLDSSLICINSGTELLNDGCWSITRPCVFFTCRQSVHSWDQRRWESLCTFLHLHKSTIKCKNHSIGLSNLNFSIS